MDDYSFEQKEKLAKKIQKLKKEKNFMDIMDIISKYNPDINITTNPSGQFMYFQNLKAETYYVIEKYIKKVSVVRYVSENSETFNTQNSHINSIISAISENSENSEITENSENRTTLSDEEKFSDNPRLKYSNKERNLIKRKNYDELISCQNEDNKINNINNEKIFVKRKSSSNKKNDVISDNSMSL